MHKLRCPKPEEFQDCVYWALLARLDQEKSKRKIKVGIKKNQSSKDKLLIIQTKQKQFVTSAQKWCGPII